MTNLQEWAERQLDDQLPLEVLYTRHPETDEEIVILKVDFAIAVVKRSMETIGFVNLIGEMANTAWEKYESERVLRPDGGGIG